MAGKPRLAIPALLAVAVLPRLALLPILEVPYPSVHDEFSYLLAAQTFAAGRFTNPTPLFWRHLESVHILQIPTYMSMYAPAQSLFLACGWRLLHNPWAGVLLSVACLTLAMFWALRAWFTDAWALAGTLLMLARWGVTSYWVNTYWGGAVPALGGALVLGSTARLLRQPSRGSAIWFALGSLILANSRPYEGFVLVLTCLLVLFRSSLTRRTKGLLHANVLIPALSMLLISGVMILLYNSQVTKQPLRLPYLEDRSQYAFAPLFVWGKLKPEPTYRSSSLRRVYENEAELFQKTHSAFGIPELVRKAKNFWIFFLGPLLSIPVIALFSLHRNKQDRAQQEIHFLWKIVLATAFMALAQVVWFYPHYAAPAFTALIAMLLKGLQQLRQWRYRTRPTGLFLSRAIPLGCLLMATLPVTAHVVHWRLSYWPLQWALGSHIVIHPASLNDQLLRVKPKALVFVHYGVKHDVGEEWVYNSADLDASQIIWAREVSSASDKEMAQYYAARGRAVWRVFPDRTPIRVEPYDLATGVSPQ